MSFWFAIPAEFFKAYKAGELIRYGAILKNAQTGQIVAHLQETGKLQKVIGVASNLDPTGISGLIGMAQNAQINSKLNAMQSMMGNMQVLQVANLASSVVSIGVTVASTALILGRLNDVSRKVDGVSEKIDGLTRLVGDVTLGRTLTDVQTALERIEEARLRGDRKSVMLSAEEVLHRGFNDVHRTILRSAREPKMDLDLLEMLLGTMMLCGSGQMRVLFEVDELGAAQSRSRMQSRHLEELGFALPRDVLGAHTTDPARAVSVAATFREVRERVASNPGLVSMLMREEVSGEAYLQRIEEEEETPFLLIPVVR